MPGKAVLTVEGASAIVSGEIADIADCIAITRQVMVLIKSDLSEVRLDLRKAKFVSASFCGFLVTMASRAAERGIQFHVDVLRESETWRMIHLVGIDRIISEHPMI